MRVARPEEMPQVYALRHEVFVLGQDVPEELERDEDDARAVHAVAFAGDGGPLVGTGRLVPPDHHGAVTRIGRLAVAEAYRGTGIGRAVLALLEAVAAERGWSRLELHAQTHALGFYERAGWTAFGGTYLDAGIEHVSMGKSLGVGA